jgi:hypothetical protein
MLETASQARKLLLKLDVDEANIDYLENAACEEILPSGNANIRTATGKFPRSPSFALDTAIQPTARFT